MKATHHNEPSAPRLVRPLITLSLTVCMLGAAPAFAVDSGDIVIASVRGEVHFVIGGTERALRVGAALEPPATVRTGHDGAIELKQGATSVSVGPDTLLEFPALAERGGPIDRIVQPSGNAFYDVGKRPGRKLRVETPYLVGVVKGTQFNVAVRETRATISLFEGLLEIHAADGPSVVDIKAGEVASRQRGDQDISVIKMDAKALPAPRSTASPGTGSKPAPLDVEGDSVLATREPSNEPFAAEVLETFSRTGDHRRTAAPIPPTVPMIASPGAPVGAEPAPPVAAPPSVTGPPPEAVPPPKPTPPPLVITPPVTSPPVVSPAPPAPVDPVITVGGVDLSTGVDLGLGTDVSGNSGNGNGNGNGNAGANSRGNGTGNSGNGDNSNHGSEDDGVHGLTNQLLNKPAKK